MNIFDTVMGSSAEPVTGGTALDRAMSGDQSSSQNPFDQAMGAASIIPTSTPVTQPYGNYNPSVEVFSGGRNTGADFGTKIGTPVTLPAGQWRVVDAFDKAQRGYIGDNEDSGYGNSVVVQNAKTGDKLRFSHLSQVDVQPGQTVTGGTIGRTGATGNVTGPHLDLEYTNPNGQMGDVLQSPYKRYLPPIGGRN